MTRIFAPFDNNQITVPDSGKIGIFRARSDADYGMYPTDRVLACQSFKPIADRLIRSGLTVASDLNGPLCQSLVHLTRSKVESLGLIAAAMALTETGSLVLVDGAKTDGIESVLNRCKAVLPIVDVVSKAHGKIFWMVRPKTLPAAFEDWRLAARPSRKPHGFLSAPGMFSADKIDLGSVLLAENMTALKGRIADLGAGWGWLSTQALTHEKVTAVDLFEAEETALNAARENITDPRATFHWQDVLAMPTTPDYDAVISNPPFHQGRAADPALGLGFIAKAAEMLRPNGVFWLVANRQLPYEAALTNLFVQTKTVRETAHFKVLCASRPLHHRKRR